MAFLALSHYDVIGHCDNVTYKDQYLQTEIFPTPRVSVTIIEGLHLLLKSEASINKVGPYSRIMNFPPIGDLAEMF